MLIFVRGRAIMKEHRPLGGNRKYTERSVAYVPSDQAGRLHRSLSIK